MSISTRNRGSTLVVALLVATILVIAAVAFLAQRTSQRSVSSTQLRKLQAESLAWAGLEDARLKLMKAREFPPVTSFRSEEFFSYTEVLTAADGRVVGRYLVQIDATAGPVAIIRSTAILEGEEQAGLTLHGELLVREDINPTILKDQTGRTAQVFQWNRVETVNVQNLYSEPE